MYFRRQLQFIGLLALSRGIIAATIESSASVSSSSSDARFTFPVEDTLGVKQVPNIVNDSAVDANLEAKGYELINVSNTRFGLTGYLRLKEATNIYGYDFEYLNLTVEYQTKDRLNVRIEPANSTDVYIVPESLLNKPTANNFSSDFSESDLVFEYDSEDFGFSVIRQSTSEVLFSTEDNPLVFSNQFIQLNTTLPEGHVISGLGESIHGRVNEPGVVKTLFANDIADPVDGNIYGMHPFYMDQRFETNTTHGVYWRTAAIQEIVVGEQSLTWRALSGIVDLYFFSGPKPKDVIKQYVKEIGMPTFQPYWALGYHQCRWGYDSIDDLEEVVDNFRKFGIPLETIWSDIDYMDSYKDFTTDPHRYPQKEFRSFLDKLHYNDQHYVPIVDAAIYVPNPNNATDNEYDTFHHGNDTDVFLKNPDGSLYIGAVWPGYTVFPDFLSENIQEYWSKEFKDWYEQIPFDGIWLDMNEVSSFCVGSCGTDMYMHNPAIPPFSVGAPPTTYPEGFKLTNASEYSSMQSNISASATSTDSASSTSLSVDSKNTLMPGKGNINYPPYAINNIQGDHDIATHDVSPNATHADGTIEYDIHNLYGLMQEKATYKALLDINANKRPFMISRSTAPGSGSVTGHWGGDNESKFAYAYFSIPQAFLMGMSGIPFFGVDVCGFNGNSDFELCSRWMQLGSFFPFYRNHNVLSANSQEPYVWSSVIEATKKTMNIRYSLLPYYYTLLQQAHATGVPILRALSWEYPDDKSLSSIDTQFFVGEALIVTPVLEPGVDTVNGTFPGAGVDEVYYDWYTFEKQDFTDGVNQTLDAPLGHIPLHIRGGNVIPLQHPGYTVAESRGNPFTVLAALDKDGHAKGKLYSDDGESMHIEKFLFVDFVVDGRKLVASTFGNYEVQEPLANVTILGVDSNPEDVTFNEKSVDFSYENQTLYITDLEDATEGGAFASQFIIEW